MAGLALTLVSLVLYFRQYAEGGAFTVLDWLLPTVIGVPGLALLLGSRRRRR